MTDSGHVDERGRSVDTSLATDMTNMFALDSSLRTLDLPGFDPSSVETMRFMFQACYRLEVLDLTSFNTAGLKWMVWMFNSCTNLLMVQVSEPFLSNFHAKDWWMFDDCPAFHSIADFTVVHQPVPTQ